MCTLLLPSKCSGARAGMLVCRRAVRFGGQLIVALFILYMCEQCDRVRMTRNALSSLRDPPLPGTVLCPRTCRDGALFERDQALEDKGC